MATESFDVTLKETRTFAPSDEFAERAAISRQQYERWLELGRKDPEAYWAEAARELQWDRPFTKVCEWEPPFAKWFADGKLNASVNCLDRHLEARGNRTAILWEGEPMEPDPRVVRWTYRELHAETERMTAALRGLGLKRGDRVAIYMPMVPEAVVAMLACARGGFTHTVVFGGFSSAALQDRMNDAQAKAVITADYGWRKGGKVQLREQVAEALKHAPSVEFVVTLARAEAGKLFAHYVKDRAALGKRVIEGAKEFEWHDLMGSLGADLVREHGKPESVDAEHPLFVLYTSGTTGKPKGIVHTTGGYLTGCLRTSKLVFDLKDSDLYWCTADIGWVTGHSYVVYGPLAAGASIFLYEGAPTTPTADRFWDLIARHKISILYTAPTAIRAFMKLGDEIPARHNLSSLRLLGSVGEPINPEAWMWYRDVIGGSRCPIVDTYWQTETGAIVISPVPGITSTKPGSATHALPGYDVEVVAKGVGSPIPPGGGGYLAIRKPWPAMARTIHGDPERFRKQYFSDLPNGMYFTGDGARKDEDGYFWVLGRVDDVLNVSGHRLGTMEIESALVSHPLVAEAAVVGRPDDLKGQAVVAFVTLKASAGIGKDPAKLAAAKNDLKAHVAREIGALARPDDVRFAEGLPKTRSGKIMRRLLRELATNGKVQGDTTTLEDLNVVAALQAGDEE